MRGTCDQCGRRRTLNRALVWVADLCVGIRHICAECERKTSQNQPTTTSNDAVATTVVNQ